GVRIRRRLRRGHRCSGERPCECGRSRPFLRFDGAAGDCLNCADQRGWASRAIDILSMSYFEYRDFAARVVDEVNNSIVALTNPVSVVVASELLGIVGPGVRR